jgi:hypothetical protein
MTREGPAWLAEFQARFGDAIRTPLERSSGMLTAQASAYDARLMAEAADGPATHRASRIAVYNRQYWFRLFDVLQSAFPMTSRLMGYWSYNDYAARFLLAHPPRGWNLDRVAAGFDGFLAGALERGDADERQALVECARIDAAWHDALSAAKSPSFRPSGADASRLLDAHLVPSPSLRIVEEHRPLVEVRRRLFHDPGASPIELPRPLERSRWWAILGTADGVASIPLEAREAELLMELGRRSVRAALSHIERGCTPEERALLPERTRAWLARSVEHDFWSGICFDR